MAANTDLLKKLSKRWVGQIGAAGVADGTVTTIPLASVTNLATATAVVVTIDRVDSNGVATPSLEETVIGVVSGSNLVNSVRAAEGTAQAHSPGAVAEVLVTAKGYNDIVDWGLVAHLQSGAHAASSISASMIAASAVLAGNLAASAVLAGNLAASAILAGNHAASSVLAGNMAASSVLLGNLAASSVSQGNMNFSVGGATIVSTGQQADFGTASTSLIDVTGVTLTIAPGATAQVFAIVTGRLYGSGALTGSPDLFIDGVAIQTTDYSVGTGGVAFALSGFASVSSGSRIIKLQVKTSTGTVHVGETNLTVIWI